MIASEFVRSRKQTRADSKIAYFIGLLFVSKISRALGIYVVSDLLRNLSVLQLLLSIKFVTSLLTLPVQKPFSNGPKLSKKHIMKVIQVSLLGCIIQLAWFYGITLVGALRAVLVFENPTIVILGVLQAFCTGGSGPAKVRGALLFILGIVCLMLLDRDLTTEAHAAQSDGVSHVIFHVASWFGLADHKAGVLLLLITLISNSFIDSFNRKVAIDIGGSKRLNALSSAISCIFLLPLFVLFYLLGWSQVSDGSSVSVLWTLVSILFVSLSVFVVDFYVENICSSKIDVNSAARWSSMVMFISAICIAPFWNKELYSYDVNAHPLDIINQHVSGAIEHGFSGGLWITVILFIMSTMLLTGQSGPRARTGQFIGFSASGDPLYVYGEDFLHRTSQSVVNFLKSTLKQILANSDSRRIFYFLCANLSFTFVEFAYGVWTNSLGLISDAFHMIFDCSALVMGLVAAVMATWKPTRIYSFGYGRVEVLSGFVNALFLLVIAFFIFTEALERLFDPPEVITEKLITVSVGGLIVNLFGMFAFHGSSHAHSHGGGGGGGHHGHSHGGGHSHSNANMQGVFLHVLADTLGSCAVILSSFLIQRYGWLIADPICSLLLSAMIFVSALPLLKQSAFVLLDRMPSSQERPFREVLEKLLQVEGVISYSEAHLWQHTDDTVVGSVHIQITQEANHQQVAAQVRSLFALVEASVCTVQVEKDSFFLHLSALRPSFESAKRTSKKPLQESLMVRAV